VHRIRPTQYEFYVSKLLEFIVHDTLGWGRRNAFQPLRRTQAHLFTTPFRFATLRAAILCTIRIARICKLVVTASPSVAVYCSQSRMALDSPRKNNAFTVQENHLLCVAFQEVKHLDKI
jgi:hypothetical protein